MKTLLIYNENSGRNIIKKDLDKIKSFFNDKNWDLSLYKVRPKEDLIKDCINMAKDYELFIVAGGDGTIHSVALSLMGIAKELRPKLLLLPYGTTNDSAKMLGMVKKVNKNLELINDENVEEIDVYKANDSYFLYAAAVGKFSKISYEINRESLRWLGPLGYFLNTFRDLFNKYEMKTNIKYNNTEINKKAFLIILAAGNRVAGFNLNKFGSKQKLNDGEIGVRIFTKNHFFSWFKMVWFYLFKGKHFKNDTHLNVKEVTFNLPNNFVWNIDGEKGPSGSLKVKVIEKSIKVYINPKVKNILF